MPDGNAALHVPAGDGEAWWFLATRMTVLVDADRSAGSLTLALQESPAGFGPPRHVHDAEDEAFFVLDGAMHIVCGAQAWDAGPGASPGSRAGCRTPSSSPRRAGCCS